MCAEGKTEMFVWRARARPCVCAALKREVCSTKEWRGPTERRIRLQLDGSERRNMVPHVLRKSSPSVHGDNPSPLHHPLLFPSFLLFLSFSCSPPRPLYLLLFTPLVHCWQKQGQSWGDGMNAGPRATLDLVYTESHTYTNWRGGRKTYQRCIFVCVWVCVHVLYVVKVCCFSLALTNSVYHVVYVI